MDLETAANRIERAFTKMNDAYRRTVFDEFLIVEAQGDLVKLHYYIGPRENSIMDSLDDETIALRESGRHINSTPGEFDFTRDGVGSDFDAYICLGQGLYLLCNNTEKSMEEVTADPRWLNAQELFLNASQYFAVDALVVE